MKQNILERWKHFVFIFKN